MKRTQIKEKAQSLVEFGLSLMVIMILLTGAVEFGLALFQYVSIRDAAQEGALYGSIAIDDANLADSIDQRVINAASDVVPLTADEVNYSIIGAACEGISTVGGEDTPNAIRVTVTFQHPIVMPLVGGIVGGQTIPLSASVTDTILRPRC